MEIIGKSIPSLQSAIASGFESVASGIRESTQVRGPETIQNAFETFSASNLGTLGSPESLPAVADVAQFSDPVQYFQSITSDLASSKFDLREFAGVINDKNFSPFNELSHLGENSSFRNLSDTNVNLNPQNHSKWTLGDILTGKYKKTPLQEGGVFINSDIKEKATQIAGREMQVPSDPEIHPGHGIFDPAGKELKQGASSHSGVDSKLSSNFAPLKPVGGNSSEAEKSGIIVVGGRVPVRNETEIKHISLPPEPVVPNPEPARLTADSYSTSAAAAAYGPELNGSAKQTATIEYASEKAKPSYDPKKSEYLQGEPPPIRDIKDRKQKEIEKKMEELDHQMPKRVPFLGDDGIIENASHPHWDFIKGSTEQNEATKNSMEKAKHLYTPKDPEYLSPDQSIGIKSPGENSPGKALNDYFSHWDKIKSSEFNASADHSETIKNALEKAKPEFDPKKPEYLDTKHLFNRKEPEYALSEWEIYDKYSPLGTSQLDKLMNPPLSGSVGPNESVQDVIEKAKPSYDPKKPEYLEGEPRLLSDTDKRAEVISGGQSGGTYFETIDDTLAKLNQNPEPQTIQLLQQQVGALQDMSTTVQQSIQMNQQLTSATLTGRFRV